MRIILLEAVSKPSGGLCFLFQRFNADRSRVLKWALITFFALFNQSNASEPCHDFEELSKEKKELYIKEANRIVIRYRGFWKPDNSNGFNGFAIPDEDELKFYECYYEYIKKSLQDLLVDKRLYYRCNGAFIFGKLDIPEKERSKVLGTMLRNEKSPMVKNYLYWAIITTLSESSDYSEQLDFMRKEFKTIPNTNTDVLEYNFDDHEGNPTPAIDQKISLTVILYASAPKEEKKLYSDFLLSWLKYDTTNLSASQTKGVWSRRFYLTRLLPYIEIENIEPVLEKMLKDPSRPDWFEEFYQRVYLDKIKPTKK